MLHPLPTQTPPFHPASFDRATQSCESEKTDGEVNKELTSQWWPNTGGMKMREVQHTDSNSRENPCPFHSASNAAGTDLRRLACTNRTWLTFCINQQQQKWCFVHLIDVTDAAVDKPRELQGLQAERNKTSGVWWYPSNVCVCSYLCLHFPNLCWRTVQSFTYRAYDIVHWQRTWRKTIRDSKHQRPRRQIQWPSRNPLSCHSHGKHGSLLANSLSNSKVRKEMKKYFHVVLAKYIFLLTMDVSNYSIHIHWICANAHSHWLLYS